MERPAVVYLDDDRPAVPRVLDADDRPQGERTVCRGELPHVEHLARGGELPRDAGPVPGREALKSPALDREERVRVTDYLGQPVLELREPAREARRLGHLGARPL